MNKLANALLGGTALVGAGLISSPGDAQTAALPGGVVAVQQSAARADAAAFNNSPTYTNCTTVSATATPLTLTITPPAGNFVYLSSITAELGTNPTGQASVAAISSTNLTGSPAWMYGTNTGSAALGTVAVNQVFPTGLKSTASGTAVTLVPTASVQSAYVCIQAAGWYSPI